jgi:hypothetical protein
LERRNVVSPLGSGMIREGCDFAVNIRFVDHLVAILEVGLRYRGKESYIR